MAATTVDMNQKIISMNLDILEEQRGQMHRAVDQYVDKVIVAGRHWITRKERNHATFLEIQNSTSKAMAFLSLKCDEMKREHDCETSELIGRGEFTQQQKNAQIDSARKPATTHGNGKEDDTGDVRNSDTFINPNLESDQQTRYQEVYNQLKSVLAKQGELEQQLNMKFNSLREDTESLKSDVGTCNQYVETGKALLTDYSQKLESLENTVSCLSVNVNEIHSDQQVLVDRINSHMSDKNDQVITDLSAKVDQITTNLTDKIDQVCKELSANVGHINTEMTEKVDRANKDLSAKLGQINTDLTDKVDQVNKDLLGQVGLINEEISDIVDAITTDLYGKVEQVNTDLSAKIDQINVVLQSLTNSEKEHAAKINKIIDLEKHLNTIEKDMQNNDKQVQQRLNKMEKHLCGVTQKQTDLSATVSMTCAKKCDLGAVGFSAERKFRFGVKPSVVGMFMPPTFIAGFEFNSLTGMFTASSEGVYLVYVSICLYQDEFSSVSLIRVYTECDKNEGKHEKNLEISSVQAERRGSTACSLDMIKLEEGDRLFIRTSVYHIVNCRIQFLCFRIG